MAEVKAPLMSMAASGKLNDEVVFFQRNGRQLVRSYVKHDGGNSEAVKKNRNIFREAAGLSRLLTESDREAYNQMTSGLAINGHNLFMKKAMKALYDGQEFLPVYGVDIHTCDSLRVEDGRLLDVGFYGESSTTYNVIFGGGRYSSHADRDVGGTAGGYGGILMLEKATTLDTGAGGFMIDGLDKEAWYWFMLEEDGGCGFSAAYQIEGVKW